MGSIEGLTSDDIHQTRTLLRDMARNARAEIPMKLHENTPGGLGSAPPFTDAFIGYIGQLSCNVDNCPVCAEQKKAPKQSIESEEYRIAHRSNKSNRTTKALRKLRRVAPLEFDVLYMILLQGLSISQVVARLNERAIRRGHLDEHYDHANVSILAVTGTEKLKDYY